MQSDDAAVITNVPGAADAIRARFPQIEIIEFTGGEPPLRLRADAFFHNSRTWDEVLPWIDAARVRWMQLLGVGVDHVPSGIFERDLVLTCARGSSAVPIAEWAMA